MQNLKDLKESMSKINKIYIFVGTENNMILRYIHKISEQPIYMGSYKEVKPYLLSMGLFNAHRVYVIKEDKDVMDKDVMDMMNKMSKKDTIIFVYKVTDSRKKFFKTAEEYSCIYEFEKLSMNSIVYYITKNLNIDEGLAAVLAKRCNMDMGRIEFEIDKLKELKKSITRKLIDDLIKKLPEDTIFELINAVARKNKKQALINLKDVMELKENPIPLLYRNFRNILLVQGYKNLKPREINDKTGINEKAVFAIRKLTGYFTLDELVNNLKLIFRVDLDVKTGRQEQVMAVNYLILKLMEE